MKTNKINIFTRCLLAILLVGFMAQTVSAQSEAQYQKLSKSFKLNSDGSQEMRYSMELTLFTHTAMNSTYGESFVVYNPQYQELIINSSYTKQANGKIINTPGNAFVPVLPANAANAPAYNHLLEMVIVHTGLELGATIYLDYTLKTKPGYLKGLDVYEVLPQSSPVKSYDITIEAPADQPVFYDLAASNMNPSKSIQGGKQTLTWKFSNLPAMSREPLVSPANGDIPVLCATTYESPAMALAVLYAQFDKGDNQQLLALAESLTENAKTDTEKVQSIMQYVTMLDNNRLTPEETGYRLRPASEVISTVYGTELEKANLLNALLNQAGIQANPVALYKVASNPVLGLKAIEHTLVACVADGQTYYLNPSNLNPSEVATDGGLRAVYTIVDGQPVIVPTQKIMQRYEASIAFKEGVPMAQITQTNIGPVIPYFANPQPQPQAPMPLPFKPQNGHGVLQLPEPGNSVTNTAPFNRPNSSRSSRIHVPLLLDQEQDYTTILPDNMTMSTPESNKVINNPAGTYTRTVTNQGNNVWRVNRTLKLNQQDFTPEQYPHLHNLLINWNDPNERSLIINTK